LLNIFGVVAEKQGQAAFVKLARPCGYSATFAAQKFLDGTRAPGRAAGNKPGTAAIQLLNLYYKTWQL
jgi:hypothetical protein